MMLLVNTSATTIYEFLQRIFSEHLRSFKKTGLVDSTGFITIILKMQHFVSFVSKLCLLVPFHLTILNKHFIKEDLEIRHTYIENEHNSKSKFKT